MCLDIFWAGLGTVPGPVVGTVWFKFWMDFGICSKSVRESVSGQLWYPFCISSGARLGLVLVMFWVSLGIRLWIGFGISFNWLCSPFQVCFGARFASDWMCFPDSSGVGFE